MAQLVFFILPIGTTLNGVRYRKMLQDKLEIHIAIYECNMLMQDSALCHRLKLVSDFLEKKNNKTLDCHGNSPNLNSIENLWAILKDKVADEQPTSAKTWKWQ